MPSLQGPYGFFEHECTGYNEIQVARRPWPRLAIYRVTCSTTPIVYHSPGGILYRIGHTFLSDRGTIPFGVRWLFPPDSYLPGFYFHDFGCSSGGLYVSYDAGKTWTFIPMTRAEIDDLLYLMVGALGGGVIVRHLIWSGVRSEGSFAEFPSGFWQIDEHGALTPFTDYAIPPM